MLGHSHPYQHPLLSVSAQARTLEVLCGPRYASCDVVCLQEVAAALVPKLAKSPLGESHHVLAPAKVSQGRRLG